MFKLVLLYVELVAIFYDWDEVSLNEKINYHAITVATCLTANILPFHRKLATSPQKRACRRFQNDQAESIFFSVSRFCGFIIHVVEKTPPRISFFKSFLFFFDSLFNRIFTESWTTILNSSSSFFHRIYF
jgi:hypothetical protein